MSIKLYDGLIACDPHADIFDLVTAIRPITTDHYRDQALRLVAKELSRIIDNPCHRQEIAQKSPRNRIFFDAEKQWLERQEGLGKTSRNHDPLRFSLSFARLSNGRILAYTFAEDPAYREKLIDTGLFADYHYQDSTDAPDEISDTDWHQRRMDWDEVAAGGDGSFSHLPQWSLPNTLVLTFNQFLIDRICERDIDDLNNHLTPEQRFHDRLSECLMGKIIDANRSEGSRCSESEGAESESSAITAIIMPAAAMVRRLARDIIDGLDEAQRQELFPAPLPDMFTTYADLPGPVVIPDDLVPDREKLRLPRH